MAAAAGQARWPVTHPAREDRCHVADGPALSPTALQYIGCNATISTMAHDAEIKDQRREQLRQAA
jgi:hypothetical protein